MRKKLLLIPLFLLSACSSDTSANYENYDYDIDYEMQIEELQEMINDLESRVSDLEDKNEDLNTKLEDLINEIESGDYDSLLTDLESTLY